MNDRDDFTSNQEGHVSTRQKSITTRLGLGTLFPIAVILVLVLCCVSVVKNRIIENDPPPAFSTSSDGTQTRKEQFLWEQRVAGMTYSDDDIIAAAQSGCDMLREGYSIHDIARMMLVANEPLLPEISNPDLAKIISGGVFAYCPEYYQSLFEFQDRMGDSVWSRPELYGFVENLPLR